MRIYNTLSRGYHEFEPPEQRPTLTLYTCGPTVYDFAHIGNLKTFVVYDTVKRVLRHLGYSVKHAINLTDIEDKIIAAAGRAGQPIGAVTEPFIAAFRADLKAMNCLPADFEPRATDFIPQQIALIEKLVASGHAYAREGSVYFRIAAFKDYGALARIDLKGIKEGARIDSDEYDKESPRDFVLWKATRPEEEAVGAAWDSPWGRGRPGWHLECSVMAHDLLGQPVDLHCGGVDLIFPHHTNEIAQSEAAYPDETPFARAWLHAEHLMVDGGKMSKSLGNFYTLKDLREKIPNFDPAALRFFFVSQHYRQSVNFTFEALEAAKAGLARINHFYYRLLDQPAAPKELESRQPFFETPLPPEIATHRARFMAALENDLDFPAALAAVYELITLANRKFDQREWGLSEISALNVFFDRDFCPCFGIDGWGKIPYTGEPGYDKAMDLLDKRSEAKAAKDYARADALRREIEALGYVVEDGKAGAKLKRK